MLRKIKKGPKKSILALFLSFDHLVCDRKQFQNFKPSSYMATHTKFGIDPTDLVPLIAHGIGSSMKFLDCLAKKNCFCDVIKHVTVWHLDEVVFPLAAKHNRAKFNSYRKWCCGFTATNHLCIKVNYVVEFLFLTAIVRDVTLSFSLRAILQLLLLNFLIKFQKSQEESHILFTVLHYSLHVLVELLFQCSTDAGALSPWMLAAWSYIDKITSVLNSH